MCTISGSAVGCGQGGTKGDGQSCGTSASDLCAAGFTCVTASSTAAQCLEFCTSDSQCNAPGGLCILQLNDGFGGSIPNVTLCTPNCSPITNSGCPAGSGCVLGQESAGQMRFLTFCDEVGTGTQFSFCDPNANNCAPGYTCLDDGFGYSCLKFCNTSSPSCSGGTFCVDIGVTLGTVNYGVCD